MKWLGEFLKSISKEYLPNAYCILEEVEEREIIFFPGLWKSIAQ